MSALTDRLGVPAVHFDDRTGIVTVMVIVDPSHIGCFLSGVSHLEHQHGPFAIPDALPADIKLALEGGD